MISITINVKLMLVFIYIVIGIMITIEGLKYRYRWGFSETPKTLIKVIGLIIFAILFWGPMTIYSALK